jgi:glutamate racemase
LWYNNREVWKLIKRTEVISLSEDRPIGVFDSGVGGLTVVRVLFEKLPSEKVVYLGDTAHVPYGSRTVEELQIFAGQIARFLVSQGAKMIVAACNTSSAVSLEYLKENFAVPIIGVIEPGVQRALQITRNGRVGVIATETTIKSQAFPQVAEQINPQVKVFGQACPQLVPLVEAGRLDDGETERVCREYLEPLRAAGVDTLILGCTHYPFLVPVIQRLMGEAVTLVDPAQETVAVVAKTLKARGQLSQQRAGCLDHRFYSTGRADSFLQVGQRMVGDLINQVDQVNLDR